MAGWRDALAHAQAEPVDEAALESALRTRWAGAAVTTTEVIHGGLGSLLHRVHVVGAPRPTLVLRQLLAELGDGPETMRREAVVHAVLPDHGLPVPAVHWCDAGGDVLGRPAALLDDVSGHLISRDLDTASARAALAATITGLHGAPVSALDALPVLTDVDGHADRFGPPAGISHLVDADAVHVRLDASRRWFVPRRQLVHCDLHGGNVLWDGTAVTGVLDWPGAAIGVGACDEAYAWLDTCLVHGREAGDALQVAMDQARPGPAPTPGEVDLWRTVAIRRALPTPAPWAESYRAARVGVSDEQVEQRFVTLVEDHLRGS